MVADLPQWKTNFYLYVGVLQEFMYDGPKSRLDPDLNGSDPDSSKNYDSLRPIGLRVVAKSARSENPVFTSI
jgi:hypothetical protein